MKKVLIANRGEIALRIIRTCQEMGLKVVAVYSQGDQDALHAKVADESVCIGPPQSKDSYLHIPSLLAAAELSGADAIHPGYGFLSENAYFAQVCRACGIQFIGPKPEHIEMLGQKVSARQKALEQGIPLLPGSAQSLESVEEVYEAAERVGFPIILKASAGGGGRGMRIVRDRSTLTQDYLNCRREASSAFGNSKIYLEKYLENPKHIEVQVFGDQKQNIMHLWERDCTIQRRHQKLIEEAPCDSLSESKRQEICECAIRLAQSVHYESAGTVEFLLDEKGDFYFMEMNTRIQVEHPVTEQITFEDLIEWQILIALGENLPKKQSEIGRLGHSFECRINAEKPETFQPHPGTIEVFAPPAGLGVRIESHLYAGFVVSPYYDSLIAKIITHAQTREKALTKMIRSLQECLIQGVETNIPFLLKVLTHPDFQSGEHTTRFLENI